MSPTGSSPASPSATVPVAISGGSPFEGCPHGSGIFTGAEVEPSLAVDPEDPGRLMTTWQQDRNSRGAALGIEVASSADGGGSWQRVVPPRLTRCEGGTYDLASDPAVSIGPDRAYLSSIGVRLVGSGDATLFDSDVVVSASADAGATWSEPVVVAESSDPLVSLDKETVLADPRLAGTAYAVWVQYTAPSRDREARVNQTFFSRTIDGGRTWSAPRRSYGGDTETQFHSLAELPDGTILDAFVEAPSLSDQPPFPARIATMRSTDAGLTWSQPVTAADMTFTVPTDPTGRDGVRGTGQGILLAAGADGASYVAWAEQRRLDGSTVEAVRSDDGGLTWGAPATVVSGVAQPFIPAVALAGDGTVGVAWYDFRNADTQGELSTDVWLGLSANRGDSWTQIHLAGPFDMHRAKLSGSSDFVGDYQGLVGLPDGFGAALALASPLSTSGPTDIFFIRVELAAVQT